MLETTLRLREDPELAAAPAISPAARVGASGDALAIDVDADPDSFAAAAALRGVLAARPGNPVRALAEHEVRTTADVDLRAWSRDAPDVTPDIWRHAEQTDARWFWALALLLLGAEAFARPRGAA